MKIRPQKILPPAHGAIFDHFFSDFLTQHRITPERNVTSIKTKMLVSIYTVSRPLYFNAVNLFFLFRQHWWKTSRGISTKTWPVGRKWCWFANALQKFL